jgi:transcriptional regulator
MGLRTSADSLDLLPGTLYAISRRIKQASSDALQVEEGSLYPALTRMLVKGWLNAEWGISDNNRKARFYRLTAEGRRQLDREAHTFDALVDAIRQVLQTV